MKYRIMLERMSDRAEKEDGFWSVVGGITVEQTKDINVNNETRFNYRGYWLDRNIEDDRDTKHNLKGFVESWVAHPFLFVFYKILHKEMNQWIKEAKWDY
jgi:hypothetical protein